MAKESYLYDQWSFCMHPHAAYKSKVLSINKLISACARTHFLFMPRNYGAHLEEEEEEEEEEIDHACILLLMYHDMHAFMHTNIL